VGVGIGLREEYDELGSGSEAQVVMGTDVQSLCRRLPNATGGNAMDIQQGEHVLVNLAPFIGSLRHSNRSIPCSVLAIDGAVVEVETAEPYRRVSLWISSRWIDGKLERTERQLLSV
jgi:hypothetical protein